MKLSNFKFTHCTGSIVACDRIDFAEVDVETGALWWRNTRRRAIFRQWGNPHWAFVDTGEFTPEYQAEKLAAAATAQAALEKT
jgi:hypothetical protein